MMSLDAVWLGTQPYASTYQVQLDLLEARKEGRIGDTVLLLEHEPTITLGRGARSSNLLASTEALANRCVSVHRVDRGGDVTLHAPGQLVAYPIVSLAPDRKDVRRYVNALTYAMARVVKPFGLDGGSLEGLVGLWLDLQSPSAFPLSAPPRVPVKVGAIGVRISRWVTMHGFALNVSNDLSLFSLIVPCGIRDYGVSSVQQLAGRELPCRELAPAAHAALGHELGLKRGKLWSAGDAALATERPELAEILNRRLSKPASCGKIGP